MAALFLCVLGALAALWGVGCPLAAPVLCLLVALAARWLPYSYASWGRWLPSGA